MASDDTWRYDSALDQFGKAPLPELVFSRKDQRHQVDILLAQQLIIMELLSIAAVLVIAELFAPGLGFQCPKAMFWFGDSIVDTGNVQARAPFISAAEYKPYGMTFFTEAFEYDRFLDPILQSINSNYANGVNFAVSGATALNTSFEVPLYLPVQIDQFLRFKQDAYDMVKTALYAVVISTNDLLNSYLLEHRSPENVTAEVVPYVVRAISHALQHVPSRLHADIAEHIPEAFNKQLYDEIQVLQKNRTGFHLLYADAYKFTLDVLDKPLVYGSQNKTKLSACCESGGEYNFDVTQPCGLVIQPNGTTLKPSEYVSWDGVHFTESFYRQLSKALLTGRYIYPSLNITQICNFTSNRKVRREPE
ncbi:GDSL esterase/lipase At1g28590 [Selaginella moellendorffii]|uniref:GDSL esterase/lipase At1g28590 n=1 Tax=Selaginella moellendorffii TaxID=88036 RepID=UPI000D1D0066|nr:GDSL esterase/lipase At1g28590 [Selaginella moellendorffii]|eukprot:XP_024518097.1 GDSL esterase/lipase At1g28590 [Selaginella moellendorffii]